MVTFNTIGELLAFADSDLAMPWPRYILSGAGSEETLRRNRRALNQLAIEQQLLDDPNDVSVRQHFLGLDLASPIITAPMGTVRMLYPEGDIEMARGAGQAGCLATVANGSKALTAIAAASSGPLFAQLHSANDPEFHQAKFDEIHRCPEFVGICVTVDGPTDTWLDHYVEANPSQYAGDIPGTTVPGHRFSWADADRLRASSKLPMGLKGIMSARDALHALDHGFDFVWISNHGARKMDSARATIDVLDEVAKVINGRAPIVVDSGFQRGSDVLKGLSRGASLVAVGKLSACALGLGGADGVTKMLNILNAELHNALACSGNTMLSQLTGETLQAVAY